MAIKRRLTAAEARAIATDVGLLKDRIYEDIKREAENNGFYTWFFFWKQKKEMVVEVVKTLIADGYKVELYEEEVEEVEEAIDRPRGDAIIDALLGLKKEEKPEGEEKEDKDEPKWREIRISWE